MVRSTVSVELLMNIKISRDIYCFCLQALRTMLLSVILQSDVKMLIKL